MFSPSLSTVPPMVAVLSVISVAALVITDGLIELVTIFTCPPLFPLVSLLGAPTITVFASPLMLTEKPRASPKASPTISEPTWCTQFPESYLKTLVFPVLVLCL